MDFRPREMQVLSNRQFTVHLLQNLPDKTPVLTRK